MRARRIETVVQYVADPEASARWYARVLGRGGSGVWFEVESVAETYRQRRADGFEFNEEPYAIPPGLLVTLNDPDGNIIGFIDNSAGGMPGRAQG